MKSAREFALQTLIEKLEEYGIVTEYAYAHLQDAVDSVFDDPRNADDDGSDE